MSDIAIVIICFILGIIWVYIVGFISGYLWIKSEEGERNERLG